MTDLQFIYGNPNINIRKQYQIGFQEGRSYTKKITPNKFGGGTWVFSTIIEITVVVRNHKENVIPPQLGNIEREIMKQVCQYRPDDIPGIDRLIYLYSDRIYDNNNGYATTIWISKIYLEAQYVKVNIEVP
jgi:hypothetical protein